MNNQEKKTNYNNTEKKNDSEKNKEKKDDELILQNKKINELKEKILENQKEIHNIKLRHLANIENIKKNIDKKITNIKNTEIENFFKQIIPIINNLEDILIMSKKFNLNDEPSIQGIELTLKSLLSILVKFGVKIEGKKNEIFNPKIHDAISIESSNKTEPNHIISVKKKGFSFKNTLLRKATVIISEN
ncbi:nucleotide exchange factor GrpE [Buchnera aphidicola]|uniref:Protein GrpE n=1 Tax=Buchnera aphidicola subsp. Rhopalosiphum maidis TaxID=118109 RepID=A0A3G2I6Q8_BUCRM|nr:nucleotide exchange factor GrpE [Buchnera aphidicola]AYN24861.1 nucleotide exchange factor GrpE [Buchnera aphidicola (Rhopalosiphum maidis)]